MEGEPNSGSNKPGEADVKEIKASGIEEANVMDERNLRVQGKLPPSSAAMFGRKSPATCNFDNRAVFNSRMQPEDRTADLRLAQRQKMCQQNQYRGQYNQARTNSDRFRFIWKDELDEQERRQWMNQPAGATRMTRYDDY
tara:strand:+ start:1321 stop:1740 length:420 start_codon:yes stop_codon:yes gene_type:complete